MRSKKGKLFLSLVALVFSLGVMCFGVYSAVQVQFNVSGNIEYTAPDIWAEFNTVIYSYPTITNTEAESMANTLKTQGIGNIDLPLAKDSNGEAYAYTYRTSQGSEAATFRGIDLNFSNCGVYFVVIEVKPTLIEQGITILATISNDTTGTNIYTSETNNALIFTQANVGQNVVIAIGLSDTSISASATIDCKITLETITEPRFETTYADGGYTITGIGTITDTELTIDTTTYSDGVNGNAPIVGVAEGAFENNSTLQSVTFTGESTDQDFVIGANAFKNCTALTSVTISKNTTTIGASAFEGCTVLSDVDFDRNDEDSSSNLQLIGSYAFSGCNLDSQSFPLNDGLRVNAYAYYNSNLSHLTFCSPMNDNFPMFGKLTFYTVDTHSYVCTGQDIPSIGNEVIFNNCASYFTTSHVGYDLVASLVIFAP